MCSPSTAYRILAHMQTRINFVGEKTPVLRAKLLILRVEFSEPPDLAETVFEEPKVTRMVNVPGKKSCQRCERQTHAHAVAHIVRLCLPADNKGGVKEMSVSLSRTPVMFHQGHTIYVENAMRLLSDETSVITHKRPTCAVASKATTKFS